MVDAELITVTAAAGLGPACGLDAAPVLARFLERHGLPVRGHRVVPAEEAAAEGALREAVAAGGLVACLAEGEGAAVVRRALARLAGSRLVLSDRVLEALAAAYAQHDRPMPRRAEALALVPQGAAVLTVTEAGEPGLLAEIGGTLVAVLPADAAVALALAREHLLPRLEPRAGEPVTVVRTLRLAGLDLGEVEARLRPALGGVESAVARVAAVDGEVWVRLALRGTSLADAEGRFGELEPVLRGAFGLAWFGRDDETLEGVLGRLLLARGLTLAVAESCTGGLIGHRITEVAGSSRYFERGLVVYSNAAKQVLLGVPEALLARYGAVSGECAEAMARGVRQLAGTDLGLSVTGIAGPEGGSPAKPVGTVFIGLADARGAAVQRHRFDRDRAGNKALSATVALDFVRRYCLERA